MFEIKSSSDIELMMWNFLSSAAVNTALEKGLFWDLREECKRDFEIAKLYSIPLDRCIRWLELLSRLQLLIQGEDQKFLISDITISEILDQYSKETWGLLAQEAREQYQSIYDLTIHISHPTSVWVSQGIGPKNYIDKMKENVERAERFTRMLFEIHTDLADKISEKINLSSVNKLLDVGGGSGVVSLALLRKSHELQAIVYDIENVCIAGRKIAKEMGMSDRISYLGGDFLVDKLPSGFDLIIECDVGIYNEQLFGNIWDALEPDGRFIIVSNTNEQGAKLRLPEASQSLLSLLHSFLSSLGTAKQSETDSKELEILLKKTGFHKISIEILKKGVIITEAHKKIDHK